MQNDVNVDLTPRKIFIPSVFGLSDWAQEFVAGARKEEIGEYALYEDPRPLYKYTFGNGQVYYEKVQPQRASTCQFLALQDELGAWLEKSLWTDSEIAEVREILGEEDPLLRAINSGELQEVQ